MSETSSTSTNSSTAPKLKPFIRKVIQLQRLGESLEMEDEDMDLLPEEHFGAPGVDVNTRDPILESIHSYCQIGIFEYNAMHISVHQSDNAKLPLFLKEHPKQPQGFIRWIHVDGISFDVIKLLANHYNLHPLAIEDIIHINQRVKVDKYPDSLFISLLALLSPSRKQQRPKSTASSLPMLGKRFSIDDNATINLDEIFNNTFSETDVQQVSVFLLPNHVVISFMTAKSNSLLQDIYTRLQVEQTLMRQSMDASLLVHALLDTIVDHALPIVSHYGKNISMLEVEVLKKPQVSLTKGLHRLQVELNILRNTLKPFSNVISSLKTEQHMISSDCRMYLNDVQDHIQTIAENIDFLSIWSKNLIDLSFNMLSYEMNMILKVLAVVSCLFLPITFLAGVYGTNFANVPEYGYNGSYYVFWAANVIIFIGGLALFKYRRWI